MFGSQPRTRRPLLLILVFGVFLAIIGITATAQSVMVSLHFSTGTLNTVVGSDSATVRAILNESVELRYLDPAAGPTERERAALEAQLAALTRPGEILRVELRRLDGTIVAGSSPGLAGIAMDPAGAASASAASPVSRSCPSAEAGAGPGELGSPTILREFLPIKTDGEVRAVVGIWRDAVPVLERLDRVRRDVVAVTLTAAIIAAILLFLIFRAAQGRLTRQTAALVDATRRDPLTGTLNHGALVGAPRGRDRARASGWARRSGSPSSTSTTSGCSTTTTATAPATRPSSRSSRSSAVTCPSPGSWAATARTSSCSSRRAEAVVETGARRRAPPDRPRRPEPRSSRRRSGCRSRSAPGSAPTRSTARR